MENGEAEERGADSEEVKQRQRSSPCRAWGRESRGRHRRWGRLELDLGEETSDLGKRPTSSTSSSGGSNQQSAGVECLSGVGLRASVGGRWREVSSAFIPSSPAPRIRFRTARARLELPHGARIYLSRCLSLPVTGSLSSRGAGLPRRLSPPQRLPRASAEAPVPLRGRLWPEAKRQPPA